MRVLEVKDFVRQNLKALYELDKKGVKNLSTAIDALTIFDEYEKYKWIPSITERKKVVATRFKVSVITVSRAIELMNKKI